MSRQAALVTGVAQPSLAAKGDAEMRVSETDGRAWKYPENV